MFYIPTHRPHCPHRTLLGLGICLTLGMSSLLAACGSSNNSATKAEESTTSTSTAPQQIRGDRYCEVLLITLNAGLATAEVWNTYPLNDCPQATWDTLDAQTLATDNNVPFAKLNGPRYWLMNSVEKAGGVIDLPKKNFGGLEMYRQATLEIGSMIDAAKPYVPHLVNRTASFAYDAGARVYELRTTEGATYVMQTYSAQIDPTLTEAQLTDLGSRLKLPEGWTYSSRILDTSLTVQTVTTAAHVLQDELGNSYSEIVKN
jgi:hypothetical protein